MIWRVRAENTALYHLRKDSTDAEGLNFLKMKIDVSNLTTKVQLDNKHSIISCYQVTNPKRAKFEVEELFAELFPGRSF